MASIKASPLDGAGVAHSNDSDLNSDDEFLCDQDEDDDEIYVSEERDIFEVEVPVENPPPYNLLPASCIVCRKRPPYSANGKSYPTCGLKCAGVLEDALSSATTAPTSPSNVFSTAGPSTFRNVPDGGRGVVPVSPSPVVASSKGDSGPYPGMTADSNISQLSQFLGSQPKTPRRSSDLTDRHNFPARRTAGPGNGPSPSPFQTPRAPIVLCVVCLIKPCRDSKYVTCGLTCAEKLCKGPPNPSNCDYCHRRPKIPGYNQCGDTCKNNAKFACLLCKCRPKYKRYHLCGKTCKLLAVKSTPLILEAPIGHATYEMVAKKFQTAWKNPGTPCPPIRKIYKIIENKSFLQPYDRYKKSVGNEVFRYHGTTRKCNLGAPGITKLCPSTVCPLCSILRTSFKTSLANPTGAQVLEFFEMYNCLIEIVRFGPGIYSSSASNKAFSYTGGGGGAMLLTKVVLGNVRNVSGWNEVMSCPAGYNSVVFDRQNGSLNETIVYSDDAIRPVFLVIF